MDLIIYHAQCTDGWCAAYVAQKRYPGARLLAAQYSTTPPFQSVEGLDVLVVDFSWKSREDNIKLSQLAKSFRILDHHKSAEEVLAGLDFATFDMNRSGAGLAWDYLFGKDSMGPYGEKMTGRPWYVDYVEDHDLWKHELPHSREINAYLHLIPKTIKVWGALDELVSPSHAASLGEGALMQIRGNAQKLVEASNSGKAWGYTIGVVNAPTWQASEVGEMLSKTYDIGLIWWERKDGIVTFSLRSQNDGDVDVSKIAAKLGGGGHKHAAGFEARNLLAANELLSDILNRRTRQHES
jgi:uncharacterized protein